MAAVAGHHRAVTSIGVSTKYQNPKTGGQGHWQQVNSVRVANHSQPAKAPTPGTKKGTSNTRNNSKQMANTGNFGNYAVGQTQKVVHQGGVTNFNVYQHIQNLNQTTIMSPD